MNWSGEMSFHWGIICQYASPLASAAQWLKGWPRNFRAASDCRCGNNCRRHAFMLFWAIARLRVGMVTLSMQRQRIGRGQSGRKGGWKGEVRQFFNPSHCQPDELLYEQVVPELRDTVRSAASNWKDPLSHSCHVHADRDPLTRVSAQPTLATPL